MAMSVDEHEEAGDYFICVRGDVHQLGRQVSRGALQLASPGDLEFTVDKGSGRLELAHWLASRDNPLTARVIVNRVWQYLLGVGLVPTPDNFGKTGQPPSHPQLLDYLASTFVDDGWSLKRLIRRIVLSRVYQISSDLDPIIKQRDPQNRWLARALRRRLDTESLRDAMLVGSGTLDLTMGGRTIRKLSQYDLGYEFDTDRRSVFVPCFRNSRLDLFEVFDAANPNVVTGKRNVSTLPTQSLFLMNSPFVMQTALQAAAMLLEEGSVEVSERENQAFLSTLGRLPRPTERHWVRSCLADSNGKSEIERWASVYHLLFASLDFRYLY